MTESNVKELYPKYRDLNIPEYEHAILSFWEANQIFQKSLAIRKGNPQFTFYEGPPSANGKPGIHHVMARTIKDLFCRYKSLKGFYVPRRAGWDTHGLPVELQVEKLLNITKADIGKTISIEEYNRICREEVMKYKEAWDHLTKRIGFWIDLENPYITFTTEYIESNWYLIKTIFEKGLLYKDYTVQPYSPAAGTGLSSHELNLPGCYRPVKDIAVVTIFEVKRTPESQWLFTKNGEKIGVLAWTTTPWTLPSNCALAINPNLTYVKINTINRYTGEPISVILAEECIGRYFQPEAENAPLSQFQPNQPLPWRIESRFPGKKLIGIRYHQLMPYVTSPELEENAFRIIEGDFVTTEEGTGVVHTASLFGADDFRVCKKEGIPSILVEDEEGKKVPLVNLQGRFRPEVTDFAGRGVKPDFDPPEIRNQPDYQPTDLLIALKLKKEGKAFLIEKYEHNYPHCWRTDKPILYYPLESWFIKVSAIKEQLLKNNEKIQWHPEHIKHGRFGKWLENAEDWNLGRSRYWGIPLPIWTNEDGSEVKCIGSIQELFDEIEKAIQCNVMKENPFKNQKELDLHRPYIDQVVLADSQGKPMYREPFLIDVWFDSGAMPYAQWHYPFENQEPFEKSFPADFIAEGIDQTRGWFYTLHVISTIVKDQPAFKNVVVNGLVLDKNGNKMSKRLGNTIDPEAIISTYGADPLRWYMIENAPCWENLRFDVEKIIEAQRKFFGTLYNTYQFFSIYANIDQFIYTPHHLVPYEERNLLDQWILAELQHLIEQVDNHLHHYNATPAARLIQHFVIEHLSNWYVRLSRRRFWKSEDSKDKQAAYQTLYECLLTVAHLLAPFIPFTAEWLYKNLTDHSAPNPAANSVHLNDFPVPNPQYHNPTLRAVMELAQRVRTLVHALRKQERIRVRQPLPKVLVATTDPNAQKLFPLITEIIKQETNVKEVDLLPEDSEFLVKKVKPNYQLLGPKYGKKMPSIAKAIQHLNPQSIRKLENGEAIPLTLEEGETIPLAPEEVIIVPIDIPGWKVHTDGQVTVALDLNITPQLYLEGLARDLVNRIQNTRKQLGLEITDRIHLQLYSPDPNVKKTIELFGNYIQEETLAKTITWNESINPTEITSIGDDLPVKITILKANS